MKKTILFFSILILYIGRVSAQVTIYSGKNFTGESKILDVEYIVGLSGHLGLKTLGSMKVPLGWEVVIYNGHPEDREQLRIYAFSDVKDFSEDDWTNKGTYFVAKRIKNSFDTNYGLSRGQYIISENGKFILTLQEDDGHLCIYKVVNGKQGAFVWGSGKHGFKEANIDINLKGDLEVYTIDSKTYDQDVKWSSGHTLGKNENKAVKAVMENDGILKLYSDSGKVVWTNK